MQLGQRRRPASCGGAWPARRALAPRSASGRCTGSAARCRPAARPAAARARLASRSSNAGLDRPVRPSQARSIEPNSVSGSGRRSTRVLPASTRRDLVTLGRQRRRHGGARTAVHAKDTPTATPSGVSHEVIGELAADLRLGGGAEMAVDRAARIGGEEHAAAGRRAREGQPLAARQRKRQRHELLAGRRGRDRRRAHATSRSRACEASSTPMSQSLRQQAPEFWQVKTTLSGSSSGRPAASPICGTLRVGAVGGQAGAWQTVVVEAGAGGLPARARRGRARRGPHLPSGRHVTHWQPRGAAPVLFLSNAGDLRARDARSAAVSRSSSPGSAPTRPTPGADARLRSDPSLAAGGPAVPRPTAPSIVELGLEDDEATPGRLAVTRSRCAIA